MIVNIAAEAYENFHKKSCLPDNRVKLHKEENSGPNGRILEHLPKDKMEENLFTCPSFSTLLGWSFVWMHSLESERHQLFWHELELGKYNSPGVMKVVNTGGKRTSFFQDENISWKLYHPYIFFYTQRAMQLQLRQQALKKY